MKLNPFARKPVTVNDARSAVETIDLVNALAEQVKTLDGKDGVDLDPRPGHVKFGHVHMAELVPKASFEWLEGTASFGPHGLEAMALNNGSNAHVGVSYHTHPTRWGGERQEYTWTTFYRSSAITVNPADGSMQVRSSSGGGGGDAFGIG